eukprot:Seg172.12 transcript_id=Seg172.12/GoldUCD/mRNA.D3Y31 product="Trafficking protein particle complex subunit 5" protein_id=Seg172.12/GoldUCD/D3Y31
MSSKLNILDRPLSKGKSEINITSFALLFSEIVQYSQGRVLTVTELQDKLALLGQHVGRRVSDVHVLREKGFKREIKLIRMLMFITSNLWKSLFGKEADKLEHANDDEATYYIIEKEPLVNKFISVPKDKGSLNCASYMGGIIEAILCGGGFPAKVSVHWHKGTTFLIKFDDAVIAREKAMESK